MTPDAFEITALLEAYNRGDASAMRRLIDCVYPELHRMAHQRLAGRPRTHELDTTALVHEAYLKLSEGARVAWRNRGHFFAVAAKAMRQIVVDAARGRRADKRGGGQSSATLGEADLAVSGQSETVIAVDLALERLTRIDRRLAQVVECRYFAGYTEAETAEALDISERTVQREWRLARGWLRMELPR